MLSFVNNKNGAIIKPIDLYCGIGIKILSSPISEKDILSLYDDFPKGFVLEELIKQSKELAELHPESVNTIRAMSINYGDEIEVKWPFLRVGIGASIVDNVAAGGIICPIDSATGITFDASDEKGRVFKKHPDTGKSLIGFQIPQWEELVSMTKEMASHLPDCHILGWDLALTDKGWCVVECNYGPNIVYQYGMRKGIRREFEQVRKRLGAKKYGGYMFYTLNPSGPS